MLNGKWLKRYILFNESCLVSLSSTNFVCFVVLRWLCTVCIVHANFGTEHSVNRRIFPKNVTINSIFHFTMNPEHSNHGWWTRTISLIALASRSGWVPSPLSQEFHDKFMIISKKKTNKYQAMLTSYGPKFSKTFLSTFDHRQCIVQFERCLEQGKYRCTH